MMKKMTSELRASIESACVDRTAQSDTRAPLPSLVASQTSLLRLLARRRRRLQTASRGLRKGVAVPLMPKRGE